MALLNPTRENRWVYFFATYLYVVILYLGSNHQHWIPVHYLPLTPLDMSVPYLPWTGWIYILVYFLPLMVGVVVKEPVHIRRVIYAFVAMTTFCTIIFVLYPTSYPRPEDALDSARTSYALMAVYLLDSPANCLPSQHVALAFLASFIIQKYKKDWGNAALVLSILISISTLTTKQHYVWDVVTGYVLARITYWLAEGRQLARSRAAR